MPLQAPHALLMIRPASFGFNPQTATTNTFQNVAVLGEDVSKKALKEFDAMVDKLRAHDIDIVVVDDTPIPQKPDAIYPNNWISFHEDGTIVHYPMQAENRRLERFNPVLETIQSKFEVKRLLDYTHYEEKGKFLEGTGSMVLDYVNRIAYACRSARTDSDVLNEISPALGFRPVLFDALDESGFPIYHTNVLMCVGTRFSLICLDAINSETDQDLILDSMAQTKHQVVAISFAQMRAFAGNMIEVQSKTGEPLLLLSEQAFQSLLPGQANTLTRYAELLPLPVSTIEKYGGGSVRCMVAGIFNDRI